MPRLGTKDGNAAPLVLAPLAEQKEIAARLDNLLAQVDSIKTRLDAIPVILKLFRQSVLVAAVSGKLTEEWRKKENPCSPDISLISTELFDTGVTQGNFGKKNDRAPEISDDEFARISMNNAEWPIVRVGAVCGCTVPNRDKPKSFTGGYHWLLTPHFDDHSIGIDYSKVEQGLSAEEVEKYKAKIIPAGNVVMTCVGRLGLAAVLDQESVINQQLHAFQPSEVLNPKFLAFTIRANRKYYEQTATSTTISYLNKTSCNSLPIPVPSLKEQTEIVRRVEQLFTFADQIEQRVKDAQSRVNNLTQSILAKAFHGELTADWREQHPELISAENSAQALLEKIKAQQAELAKTSRKKRK